MSRQHNALISLSRPEQLQGSVALLASGCYQYLSICEGPQPNYHTAPFGAQNWELVLLLLHLSVLRQLKLYGLFTYGESCTSLLLWPWSWSGVLTLKCAKTPQRSNSVSYSKSSHLKWFLFLIIQLKRVKVSMVEDEKSVLLGCYVLPWLNRSRRLVVL